MSTQEERVAAIDTPDKAIKALREIADLGRVFNVEMAAMIGKSADVLESALAPPSPPCRPPSLPPTQAELTATLASNYDPDPVESEE